MRISTLKTLALVTAGLVAAANVASAELSFSSDVDATVNGTVVPQSMVARSQGASVTQIESLGGALLPGTSIDGFHDAGSAGLFFSIDRAQLMPDIGFVEPSDVIAYDGSRYSLVFDGSLAGVGFGANIDAISLDVAGDLVLSFDTTLDLGIVVADEDLVRFDGNAFAKIFDGSAIGLDPALDVDAVDYEAPGVFRISLDAAGDLGGVIFADEDLLTVSASGGQALVHDGSALAEGWIRADLEAVAVPEPAAAAMLAAGILLLAVVPRRRFERSRRPLIPSSLASALLGPVGGAARDRSVWAA